MADLIKVSIEYPGYPEHTDNIAYVTPLGRNRYRFEEDPMLWLDVDDPEDLRELPDFRDVFEAEEVRPLFLRFVRPLSLRFVRVVERARFTKYQFILNDRAIQSAGLKSLLSKVDLLEGHWERVMEGVLTIFLPKQCDYDPTPEIRNCMQKGPGR